jgi:hypothetical protein
MERRVPTAVFDARFKEQVRVLLRRVSPPATAVMFCHLDAPGWCLVDLDEAHSLDKRSPRTIETLTSKPTIATIAPVYHDDTLSLAGTMYTEHIFWEWSPSPRYTAYGWFPATGWEELRRLIASIHPAMRKLLSGLEDRY